MIKSHSIKIALVLLVIILIGACSMKEDSLIGEHSPRLKDYPAIASFALDGQQSVKFLGIAWQKVKNLEVPFHVDKYFEFTRKSQKDYTVHTIVGIDNTDTLYLNYWIYSSNDTVYGNVRVDNGSSEWGVNVCMYVNGDGVLTENGTIQGINGKIDYKGELLNDSIVAGEWKIYTNGVLTRTFADTINVNRDSVPQTIENMVSYIDSVEFLENNLTPIPVEMVNQFVEDAISGKQDPALLSWIGATAVGVALGLIYPGALGCWLGTGGSFVYSGINYLITRGS